MRDEADRLRRVPTYYVSPAGVTHRVTGSQVHTDVLLLWTLCEVDVPAGRAFTTGDGSLVEVTCVRCHKLERMDSQ